MDNLEFGGMNDMRTGLEGVEYHPKKVVDKRFISGRVKYLLKWDGGEDHIWKGEEELGRCVELVKEYEREWKERKEVERKERADKRSASGLRTDGSSAAKRLLTAGERGERVFSDDERTGFDRGLTAEAILGATKTYGSEELNLMVKWKETGQFELVPVSKVNLNCPQMVIEFYQSRLTFGDSLAGPDLSKNVNTTDESDLAGFASDATGQTGFDRGLIPEEILGVLDSRLTPEPMFMMKWKDTEEPERVTFKQANAKCPQMVLSFYEKKLVWTVSSENDNNDK